MALGLCGNNDTVSHGAPGAVSQKTTYSKGNCHFCLILATTPELKKEIHKQRTTSFCGMCTTRCCKNHLTKVCPSQSSKKVKFFKIILENVLHLAIGSKRFGALFNFLEFCKICNDLYVFSFGLWILLGIREN